MQIVLPVRSSSLATLIAAIFVFMGSLTHAQQQPQAGGSQDVITLHTETSLVLVDVVVSKQGEAVHALQRSNFHLFEDDHEVPITYFDEEDTDLSPQPSSKHAVLPPHVYSNVPTYPATTATNILLLDNLNTAIADQSFARQQALKYIRSMAPGTEMAIFTLGTRLQLIQSFTQDPLLLKQAIESSAGAVKPSVALDVDQSSVMTQGAINMQGAISGRSATKDGIGSATSFTAQTATGQAQMNSFYVDERQRITLDALRQIAGYLSALPGRKNLIWLSDSFPMMVAPQRSDFSSMRNYAENVQQTADLLTSVHAAVYPIYAAGVEGFDFANAKSKTQGTDPTTRAMDQKVTMESVAAATGGEAYVNTNGLAEAISKAVANGSHYYTIGYRPSTQVKDTFHTFKVKVDGGRYQLYYRHGYYEDPSGTTGGSTSAIFNPMRAAVLYGAPPETQVSFQARVLETGDPDLDPTLPQTPIGAMANDLRSHTRQVTVDLKIDASSLKFEEATDHVHHDNIEWMLVGYDDEGRCVNYAGGAIDVTIPAKEFQRAVANGLALHGALTMPTTRSSLRLVVRDLNSNRIGAVEVPLPAAPIR